MLARLHRTPRGKDEGFTLIELLVVMIIIGILAAIAVPVFLTQRAKAHDTATKSDVTSVGKEVATYYVDNTAQLFGLATAGQFKICTDITCSDAAHTITTMKLSSGSAEITGTAGASAVTYPAACTNYAGNWRVGLTNTTGSSSGKTWYYTAQSGLVQAGVATAEVCV